MTALGCPPGWFVQQLESTQAKEQVLWVPCQNAKFPAAAVTAAALMTH
jgi:hypothetical protein